MSEAVSVIRERRQAVLHDKKWLKLLSHARLFRFVPFIDLVMVAGSMATGEVRSSSDFDIIVGVRRGRMFTARFLLIIALDLFGWRRKNLDHGEASADTLCLNHFVTHTRYRLQEPHGAYWKELYQSLVPIYGELSTVQTFYDANVPWMGERVYGDDLRHKYKNASIIKIFLEKMLLGKVGDWLEKRLSAAQIRRINTKLLPHVGYKPRLIISDDELELHLDTRRIEELERG